MSSRGKSSQRPGNRRAARIVLGIIVAVIVLGLMSFGLVGCAGEKKSGKSPWNQTIKTTPAPSGWVNSKDGAFRVKIPPAYLDAYDAVQGTKLPDAQVVLSLPSDMALNGYIPVMVIDHAKATSDPQMVEKSLKTDDIYKDYTDFVVLNPTQVEGLNVLEMKWKYTFQEVQMTAFMTLVSGNNHAYAFKQDVPDYAMETYRPIIDTVLKTWTWNQPLKK